MCMVVCAAYKADTHAISSTIFAITLLKNMKTVNLRISRAIALLLATVFIVGCEASTHHIDISSPPSKQEIPTTNKKALTTPIRTASPQMSHMTPPAQIKWAFIKRGEPRVMEGKPFYFLPEGFIGEVVSESSDSSTANAYVPEQFRLDGETASMQAAARTCDVSTYVGSKTLNLYGGVVAQGYQFTLKSGTNLLVVPSDRLLKSVVMVQTIPGSVMHPRNETDG